MINFSKKMVEKEVVDSIQCNKCDRISNATSVEEYEGLMSVQHIAGYNSVVFNDGDKHEFSLCEFCLKELFNSFITPPNYNE
jgi:hypothetical protein